MQISKTIKLIIDKINCNRGIKYDIWENAKYDKKIQLNWKWR